MVCHVVSAVVAAVTRLATIPSELFSASVMLLSAFALPFSPSRLTRLSASSRAVGVQTSSRRKRCPGWPPVLMAVRESPGNSNLGRPRPGLGSVDEGRIRVVCVGDVHGQWSSVDEAALNALHPSMILFAGDFGNEDVEIVRSISEYAKSTDTFVSAVLGNHDGFYSMSEVGRRNCPYNPKESDRVQQQLDLLEPFNPAYRSIAVDSLPLPISVVGGRPLTWGGPMWKCASFYRKYFGVSGMEQSSELISKAAVEAEAETVIFLSHNGPTGLGSAPSDPCGKDFGEQIGGDFGDEDLRAGVESARASGKAVPLVVFGHMHQQLQRGGNRTMLRTELDGHSAGQTVMLDTAVVPRHRQCPDGGGKLCQFTVVELDSRGHVDTVEQIWVKATGEVVKATVLLDVSNRPAENVYVASV